MSEEFQYPELSENTIVLVSKIYANNPKYFDHPDCPYKDSVKDVFKGKGKHLDYDSHTQVELPESDNLIAQVNSLNSELSQYGQNIKDDEGAAKNTYFRLKSMMVEKLIDLKERATKIKQHEAFVQKVLEAIGDLDVDSRNRVLKRIKELV